MATDESTPDSAADRSDVADAPTFDPPGPGRWQLDRSHYGGGTTPLAQWLQVSSSEPAFRRGFAELGIPADTLVSAFVNGFMYTRLRPLVRPDQPAAKLPPALVLKAISRLHPAFRRRTRTAARVVEERPWRRVIDDWHARIKPEMVARNLELGAIDLTELDDHALAAHVELLITHTRDACELHFWLHNYDLGPIGLLLADIGSLGAAHGRGDPCAGGRLALLRSGGPCARRHRGVRAHGTDATPQPRRAPKRLAGGVRPPRRVPAPAGRPAGHALRPRRLDVAGAARPGAGDGAGSRRRARRHHRRRTRRASGRPGPRRSRRRSASGSTSRTAAPSTNGWPRPVPPWTCATTTAPTRCSGRWGCSAAGWARPAAACTSGGWCRIRPTSSSCTVTRSPP